MTLGERAARRHQARLLREDAARVHVLPLSVPDYTGPCALECHRCRRQAPVAVGFAAAAENARRSGWLEHERYWHCSRCRWDKRKQS